MRNRYFAADLLGRIAVVRHDLAAAYRYAVRSDKAGEDSVRFNPSDLGTWGLWVTGRELVANMLIQQGQVNRAIEVLRSTTALANDPRLPSSLGPNLISTWFTLTVWEAETGQRAAANRSFDAFVKARKEFDKLCRRGFTARRESRPGVVGSGALPAGRGRPNCRLRLGQCVNPRVGAIVLQYR
jgi:hypothetical protein